MANVPHEGSTSTGVQVTQVLTAERLVSGDQPSVLAAGIYAAASFRKIGMVVMMADALGRIHTMPAEAIQVLERPRVKDDELDLMDEDTAIETMVKQEDSEEFILAYLKRRMEKTNGDSSL